MNQSYDAMTMLKVAQEEYKSCAAGRRHLIQTCTA